MVSVLAAHKIATEENTAAQKEYNDALEHHNQIMQGTIDLENPTEVSHIEDTKNKMIEILDLIDEIKSDYALMGDLKTLESNGNLPEEWKGMWNQLNEEVKGYKTQIDELSEKLKEVRCNIRKSSIET